MCDEQYEQLENAIAPQYDERITYTYPVFLWHDHILYTNPKPLTMPEPFTPEHWEKTSIYRILNS